MSKQCFKQDGINAVVWDACAAFRGAMNAGDYKDYVLVMLFLKCLSGCYKGSDIKARQQDCVNIHDGQTGRCAQILLPESANFAALYAHRADVEIGSRINHALDALEQANPHKLGGMFQGIDFNSEKNLGKTLERARRLKLLLESFKKLDFAPDSLDSSEDVIGNTYMYLLNQFSVDTGKKSGEFYTPHKLSQLLIRLCKPVAGSSVCDPACGSGGLLLEAAKFTQAQGEPCSLYGMESNARTWALCKMNLFLHGIDSARIECCNTLLSPLLVETAPDKLLQFDYVVANPPFSLKKWGAVDVEMDVYRRFWRGMPPDSTGDYAFISHMIETATKRKGRIAVIVPHGVLFRGKKEGKIREKLIRENLLDAVIGLPPSLFPSTQIPVAILVFDRARELGGVNAHRKDVLFIDASSDYQRSGKRNALLDSHVDRIVKAYENRESVEKYAHLASYEEIQENDFNLNIPRYVDTFEDEEAIDIDAVTREIAVLEAELDVVRSKMREMLKQVVREKGSF